MELWRAFRIHPGDIIAFAGAGGKTSAIFTTARQAGSRALITTTTHFFEQQSLMGDRRWQPGDTRTFDQMKPEILKPGVHVLTGIDVHDGRVGAPPEEVLICARDFCRDNNIVMLVEADGAKTLPAKAPAEHEPAIPAWVDNVIVCCGLKAVGTPLDADHVHRPELFAKITGTGLGASLTINALAAALLSPQGGLKNIPQDARRIAFLNQAETAVLQAGANRISAQLLGKYDAVVSAVSLGLDQYGYHNLKALSVQEKCAGVILAGGKSSRMGEQGNLKQLLDWRGKPFIWHVIQAALQAGLDPVCVVTGAESERVEKALEELPVDIVYNPHWENGQSTSVRAGVEALPPSAGAAVFLMADQPQIQATLIQSLVETHSRSLAPITAPFIDGRRGNPVLFDRSTFPELLELKGDSGGRALFSKHPIEWLSWTDASMLMDIDTLQDYENLLGKDKNGRK